MILRRLWLTATLPLLLLLTAVSYAQVREALCSKGVGGFQTSFFTGVKVIVGAAKKDGFATRFCSATLGWGKDSLVAVPQATLVDIDALGVDLGPGSPALALQVKGADSDWYVTYKIYSLEKPARLLRTIVGGSSFSATDTNLDGQIEIWTDDAHAVDGIEQLSIAELDFAPTMVLRFDKGKLLDVSAEFQAHFDKQIALLKAKLDSKQLSDFRDSDGKLAQVLSLSMDQRQQLRMTKIKVLEVVWAYLYSGREQEAWRALAEMWPPADYDRVRWVISNARAGGIERQIDGVELKSRPHPRKAAYIYETGQGNNGRPEDPTGAGLANIHVDSKPQAILLRRAAGPGSGALPESEEIVDVVIDAAGKVRSAESVEKKDDDLANDCLGWKFIPAFKDGRPVASRTRLALSYFR